MTADLTPTEVAALRLAELKKAWATIDRVRTFAAELEAHNSDFHKGTAADLRRVLAGDQEAGQ